MILVVSEQTEAFNYLIEKAFQPRKNKSCCQEKYLKKLLQISLLEYEAQREERIYESFSTNSMTTEPEEVLFFGQDTARHLELNDGVEAILDSICVEDQEITVTDSYEPEVKFSGITPNVLNFSIKEGMYGIKQKWCGTLKAVLALDLLRDEQLEEDEILTDETVAYLENSFL